MSIMRYVILMISPRYYYNNCSKKKKKKYKNSLPNFTNSCRVIRSIENPALTLRTRRTFFDRSPLPSSILLVVLKTAFFCRGTYRWCFFSLCLFLSRIDDRGENRPRSERPVDKVYRAPVFSVEVNKVPWKEFSARTSNNFLEGNDTDIYLDV